VQGLQVRSKTVTTNLSWLGKSVYLKFAEVQQPSISKLPRMAIVQAKDKVQNEVRHQWGKKLKQRWTETCYQCLSWTLLLPSTTTPSHFRRCNTTKFQSLSVTNYCSPCLSLVPEARSLLQAEQYSSYWSSKSSCYPSCWATSHEVSLLLVSAEILENLPQTDVT